MGLVNVSYEVTTVTDGCPSGARAADTTDFLSTEASVVFNDSETQHDVTVFLYDDMEPEPEECLTVRLLSVRLLSQLQDRQRMCDTSTSQSDIYFCYFLNFELSCKDTCRKNSINADDSE
mgnify:CR=1 FL=1